MEYRQWGTRKRSDGRLEAIHSSEKTYLIQSTIRVTVGDNLNRCVHSFRNVHACHVRDHHTRAEVVRTLFCDCRPQNVVECGAGVVAEREQNLDIRLCVMHIHLNRSAVHGPHCTGLVDVVEASAGEVGLIVIDETARRRPCYLEMRGREEGQREKRRGGLGEHGGLVSI